MKSVSSFLEKNCKPSQNADFCLCRIVLVDFGELGCRLVFFRLNNFFFSFSLAGRTVYCSLY